jgi:CRISPR-associated endoribonuclease Cas2 subtype I-E
MIIIIVDKLPKQKKGMLKTYMIEIFKNVFVANNISSQLEKLWEMCQKYAKGGILIRPDKSSFQKIKIDHFGTLSKNVKKECGVYVSTVKS